VQKFKRKFRHRRVNVETKQTFDIFFNSLKKNQSVKIILNTQSENDTFTLLQDIAKQTLSNGFDIRDEQLIWSDLTTSSQKNYLKSQSFSKAVKLS
jgi:hypothetical protein